MNPKIRKLEARIEDAVGRARALGYKLVAQGSWGVKHGDFGWVPEKGEPEVCICGAIALAENPKNGAGILRAIAKKYGITVAQAASLSDGFENLREGSGDPDAGYPKKYEHDSVWYRIGKKWRERADRVAFSW